MSTAVVFGGYGTFGTHVVRELVRLGIAVVVAGRDLRRAEALAEQLGRPHRAVQADVTSIASFRNVLHAPMVAVNCAGPYDRLGPALLDACLEAGCHYADICDDRGYTTLVRSYGPRFAERGLAAVHGCSSLPGISGALALLLLKEAVSPPVHVRVTLFVGNANAKGLAAIQSVLGNLGQPIETPQGTVMGFRRREVVSLPKPFGRRGVFNFITPEHDLFPALLGVRTVAVKLGFQLRLANYSLAALAALGGPARKRLGPWLGRAGNSLRFLGTSGGAVMTELFFADGSTRRATMLARTQGQIMASLPCALAVEALCNQSVPRPGALSIYELLEPATLLERLTAEGFELVRETSEGR
jgi:hypothetical protein